MSMCIYTLISQIFILLHHISIKISTSFHMFCVLASLESNRILSVIERTGTQILARSGNVKRFRILPFSISPAFLTGPFPLLSSLRSFRYQEKKEKKERKKERKIEKVTVKGKTRMKIQKQNNVLEKKKRKRKKREIMPRNREISIIHPGHMKKILARFSPNPTQTKQSSDLGHCSTESALLL